MEIQALLAAEERAEKVPEAAEAVQAVDGILELIESANAEVRNSELSRLTALLNGAVRAVSLDDKLKQAERAKEYAEAVARRIEQEDEEIAAVFMLLN